MFESSLIDLEARKQPQRRRWLSLPLAIVLHLVGLTAFAFANYWSVSPVQDPPTLDVFTVFLPPPLPPGGGGGHPKPPQPQPHPQPATAPVQPQTVPDKPPAPAPPAPVDPNPGPVKDDSSSPILGHGDGPPGPGPSIGPPGPAVEPAVEDTLPLHLTAEMTRPVPLRPILPRYTEAARRVGMQGTVTVEAIIDEQGNATNVHVLRGLPMGLDLAAMEAIQQTRFKPAMMGGRPVKVYYNLTVTFTIQR